MTASGARASRFARNAAANWVALLCGVFSTLPTGYFTQDDLGEALVTAKLPIGTPLSMTDATLRKMEAAVASHPYVVTTFASAGDELQYQPHKARMNLLLTEKADWTREFVGEGRGSEYEGAAHWAWMTAMQKEWT